MNTTTTFSDPELYEQILEYYQHPSFSEKDINSLYFKKDVDLDIWEKTPD